MKPLSQSIADLLLTLDGKGEGTPKTLDQRLADAKAFVIEVQTQVDALTRERDTAKTDLQTAKDETARLQTQFDALTGEATTAKADVTRLNGELSSEKTAHTTTKGQLESANKNGDRLSKLCAIKGINPDAAPPAIDQPQDELTPEQWEAKYNAAATPEAKRDIAQQMRSAADAKRAKTK